mmetsp:Transcript_21403/g.34619  ORF Transcript_21403/g.34619 Transcript_21403/m.34619 type:complete len:368 (-) Transcript_21403:86-1189(-)
MSDSQRKRRRSRNAASNLPQEMQRCLQLLTAIQSRSDAEVFLHPVDWKTLGLDDYPKIIKQPMDLGTVERKLTNGKYKDIDGFAKDMRLIWDNTMTYNVEGSDIHRDALSLSNMFNRKFKDIEEFERKQKESAAESTPAPARKRAKTRNSEKKTSGSDKKPGKNSDKKPARSSEQRPGKEGKMVAKSEKKTDKSTKSNKKECEDIIAYLKGKEGVDIFLDPVDWKALELPDYPTIIKHPMDLGTLSKNVSNNQYATLDDFAEDMRLIWNNAMEYNQPGSDVYLAAKKFLDSFEKKFKKINKGGSNTERQKFCDALRTIDDNQKLAELVTHVQKLCPAAMELKNGKEITIQIGKLDSSTIKKLLNHLD